MDLHNDFTNYKGHEVVKSEHGGDTVTIGFNANMMLNAISVVSEEVLKFVVGKPNQACFINTHKTTMLITPYA
jgi:DNA polymerase III sliding clamp (beta) subunit (PCNA family)